MAGKYDAEGKHAARTSPPSVNGESNLAMSQSLLVVSLLYGRSVFDMTWDILRTWSIETNTLKGL